MLQGWNESLLYNWCKLPSTYTHLIILVVLALVTNLTAREQHKIYELVTSNAHKGWQTCKEGQAVLQTTYGGKME